MEILKHRPRPADKKPFYHMVCPCGCEFILNEVEFQREKCPDEKVYYPCPECGHGLNQSEGTPLTFKEKEIKLNSARRAREMMEAFSSALY